MTKQQTILDTLSVKPRLKPRKVKTQLRIHVMGAPYAISSKETICSPFVQRTVTVPKMLSNLHHQVYHYGHEKSDVICTEHITVTDDEVLKKSYGDDYDKRKHPPKVYDTDEAFKVFHNNVETELRKRIQPDDVVLSLFGWGDKALVERISDLPCHVIEASIGYPDSFHDIRVFQSPSKMNFERGRSDATIRMKSKYPDSDPAKKFRNWETLTGSECDINSFIIPPVNDPDDFTYSENKKDFMLFIGRVERCKGLDFAIKLSEHTKTKLIIAGPLKEDKQGKPIPFEKLVSVDIPNTIEYIGIADLDLRRELFRDAKVSILPSLFLEPGFNTHIQSALSGTPTITFNHGIAMDYFWNGICGFLCQPDDFSDIVEAYERIGEIKHEDCRQYGLNYSLECLGIYYHEWIHKVIRNNHRQHWEVPPKNDRTDLDYIQFKPIYPYPEEKIKQKIQDIRHKINVENGGAQLTTLPDGTTALSNY